jgi:hypothetical protein
MPIAISQLAMAGWVVIVMLFVVAVGLVIDARFRP